MSTIRVVLAHTQLCGFPFCFNRWTRARQEGERMRGKAEKCEEEGGIACVRDGGDHEHGAVSFECLLVCEALERV